MKHVFYEKMPYSTSKWEFSDSSPDPKEVDWCVTEKCHGANFSFLCDGSSITHARRNDILQEKEKFFGYKIMAEKHKDNVLNAYQLIINNQELMQKYVANENNDKIQYQLSQVSIYGEMFGGFFPQQQRTQNGQKQQQQNKQKQQVNKQKQAPKKQKQEVNKQTRQNNVNNNNNDNGNNNDNNPNRKRRRRRRGKRGGKNNNKKNGNHNDEFKQNGNDNDNNSNPWITKGRKTQNESSQKQSKQVNKQENKPKEEEKKNDKSEQERNYVVQREILYCPGIEFYAFDIAVILKQKPSGNKRNRRRRKKKENDEDDKGENEDELTIRKYMDYSDAIEIFKASKFFYAKPLFIGSFEDCCKYDYEFKSKIPTWLGLKPLAKEYGNNLAEGVIVKPMRNIYYTLGEEATLKRAIVKLKHPLFQERIGDFQRKFKDKKENGKKNEKGDKDLTNINMMMEMMNVNRYQSVISKHGNPNENNYDFFVDKMVKDIFEDIVYIEENEINEWWESRILKREQLLKYIEKKLQKKAMDIILNQK